MIRSRKMSEMSSAFFFLEGNPLQVTHLTCEYTHQQMNQISFTSNFAAYFCLLFEYPFFGGRGADEGSDISWGLVDRIKLA